MPYTEEDRLWYEQPASNWNEALPLGNGRLGAMLYGGAHRETISLNEDTLWSGYPRTSQREGMPACFQRIRKLVMQGEMKQAQTLAEEEFGDVLFSMINAARLFKINPDNALEHTNQKFIRRFNYLEQKTLKQGRNLTHMTLAEMDEIWEEAKKLEK